MITSLNVISIFTGSSPIEGERPQNEIRNIRKEAERSKLIMNYNNNEFIKEQ